jgi:uncharacterized membrane protein
MKKLILNRRKILLGITIWWFSFAVLSIIGRNNFQVLNVVGFAALIILPGLLTLMITGVVVKEFWGYVALAIGISLLELMGIGLLANTLMPFAGVRTPLDKGMLLLIFSDLIFLLLAIAWKSGKDFKVVLRQKFLLFESRRDSTFAFFPIIFVAMSVLGAIRLNNGGDGVITLMMLIAIGAYCAVLIYHGKNIGPNVIPIALFFISLSLLFMTSLRGWSTTGHDIQREYRVFEITKNSGIWNIQNLKEAYNACMSITILPTIFCKLLDFPDPYVYKIFFQIIFAVVPGIIYITVKRYANNITAFLSVLYFISFPTFFSDMPMLNRQEIAFLFLALMSYVIFDPDLALCKKRFLFVMFGLGIVISHYSTTYAVIAILIFFICARQIVWILGGFFREKGMLRDSGISTFNLAPHPHNNRITFSMVLVLILASFFWSSILTDTSSNSIMRVVLETIEVMQDNTRENTKSGDVLYSLFAWQKFDPGAKFEEYDKEIISETRRNAPEGTYYEEAAYKKYPMKIIADKTLPLTALGQALDSEGVDVVSLNYIFRQGSAKVLQILIVVGFIFALWSRKFLRKPIDTEFVLLAVGSLILVLSQVVLPMLSIEYGLLRAFQQAMFFLGIFVVIGSFAIVSFFKRSIRIIFPSMIAITFFLSSTGVFTYLLGGYGPQLHLDNDGTYYDIYYLHGSEIAGIEWLANKIHDTGKEYQSEAQSDRYAFSKAQSIANINLQNDIHPGIIRRDSYVYLGFTNINKDQTTVFYDGDLITYTYPVDFLDENKDLIYSNSGARIYR